MRYLFGAGHGVGASNTDVEPPAPPVDPLKVLGVWVRPPDWPTLPTIAPGEEKIVVSFAVFETSPTVVFSCFDSFHITWGDGKVEDFLDGGGGSITHTYDYANPALTPTSRGYKVAVAVITPAQDANLVEFSINKGYDVRLGVARMKDSQILELIVSAPLLATLRLSTSMGYTDASNVSMMNMLEHLDIRASNLSSVSNLALSCHRLGKVSIGGSPLISVTQRAFKDCHSLVEVGDLTLPGSNSITWMFDGCYSLFAAPSLDGLLEVSGVYGAFKDCLSLTQTYSEVASNGDSLGDMFRGCISLQLGPTIIAPNATWVEGIFGGCINLKSVGGFDAPSAEQIGGLFSGCWSVESLPLMNSTKAWSAAGLFNQCYSLQNLPIATINPRTDADPIKTVWCEQFASFCFGLTTVNLTMPANALRGSDLAAGSFQNCISLYSLSGITNIRSEWDYSDLGQTYTTFMGCGNLRLLSLPNSTDTVGLPKTLMGKPALLSLASDLLPMVSNTPLSINLTGAPFADDDVVAAFSSRGYGVVR